MVTVGKQGEAVNWARSGFTRLPQRNQGWPRDVWNVIENSTCLYRRRNDMTKGLPTSMTSQLSSAERDLSSPLASTKLIRSNFLPEAVLIGVQKGGTTALYKYLDQHPDIANTKKELYFIDEQLDRIMIRNAGGGTNTSSVDGGGRRGIPQLKAQQEYGMIIRDAMQQQQQQPPEPDHGKMILDLTPNYIFQSDRLPQRISCILPWAKIIVLLRDPVERARSQYDMKLRFLNREKRRKVASFDGYIRADLKALKETGVIQDWSVVDFDAFFNSSAMHEAWRTYLNSGLNAPIGMGLYALQLKPFLEQSQGHKFLAIRSEELKANTDETYGHVLDFLGLPRITLNVYPAANQEKKGTQVKKSTAKLLQEIFAPFNRKLGELLGGDWVGVWER